MGFIIKYLFYSTSVKVLKNDHHHKYQNVNWLFLLENKPWSHEPNCEWTLDSNVKIFAMSSQVGFLFTNCL
jgi:hypothetical protein